LLEPPRQQQGRSRSQVQASSEAPREDERPLDPHSTHVLAVELVDDGSRLRTFHTVRSPFTPPQQQEAIPMSGTAKGGAMMHRRLKDFACASQESGVALGLAMVSPAMRRSFA